MRALYRRLGRVIDVSPRTIHRRVIEGVAETPYSNVTIKTDVAKAAFNYLRERKEQFPGIAVEKLYLRNYPHDELAAQLFGTLREISPKELKERRYRGVARRARGSAPAASSTSTTPTCAARTATRRSSSTRSATATSGARPRAWSPSRATSSSSRSTSTSSAPPTTRCGGRSRPRRSTAPRRAPTWRWTRATARSSRSAPTRASTRTCSPSRSPSASTTSSTPRPAARRCSTARSPRPIRPARPSSS